MENSIQVVAYLLRKTSLTLTEIRGLEIDQLTEVVQEVAFQESVAEYQTATYLANILSAIANSVPRKGNRTYKVTDFLNIKEPRRTGPDAPPDAKEELEALARKFNIKLPGREILEF